MDTQQTIGQEPQPKKRTNGKRNKRAGSQWEYECRDILKALGFPHVTTCRTESKNRDNQAIDLINEDEYLHGRLPLNIQCKNSVQSVNYEKIFNGFTKTVKTRSGKVLEVTVQPMGRVPGIINAIWHKMTGKSDVKTKKDGTTSGGKVFRSKGQFATTTLEDHLILVKAWLELKKYKEKYGELCESTTSTQTA